MRRFHVIAGGRWWPRWPAPRWPARALGRRPAWLPHAVLLLALAATVAATLLVDWPLRNARTIAPTSLRVVDGDTLHVRGGARIRLHGIDAPESAQYCYRPSGEAWPCGRLATDALRDLVFSGGDLRCETKDVDRYDRA